MVTINPSALTFQALPALSTPFVSQHRHNLVVTLVMLHRWADSGVVAKLCVYIRESSVIVVFLVSSMAAPFTAHSTEAGLSIACMPMYCACNH